MVQRQIPKSLPFIQDTLRIPQDVFLQLPQGLWIEKYQQLQDRVIHVINKISLVPMWTINQTNNQTKNPFCWKMPVVLFDFWWYINSKSRHGKSTLKSFLLISSLGKQLRNVQVEYKLWCSASSLFQHISQPCREPDLPTKRGLSSSISAESLLHVEIKLWCSRKAIVQTSHSMRYQSRIMTQPRNIALGYSLYNPTALPGDLE